jgi:chloride channel protein, CIC family
LWRGRRDCGGIRRPLTGAFYAFELVIGAYSLANAIPVFAATLTASLTTQAIIGAPYDITAPRSPR